MPSTSVRCYYIRAKDGSPALAEAFLDRLSMWPIDVVQNAFDDVLAAARLKVRFRISYADAFAAATAMRTDAILVTGDPEFHALEALIEIDWLPSTM